MSQTKWKSHYHAAYMSAKEYPGNEMFRNREEMKKKWATIDSNVVEVKQKEEKNEYFFIYSMIDVISRDHNSTSHLPL